jgi:hypothetical protein
MQQERSPISGHQEKGAQLPLIYILGNSHCGSTLLGFLLSSHPDIINVGELKTRTWLKDRYCTCGQPVESCPLYRDYFPTFNAIKQNIVKDGRRIFPLRFLLQKKINPGQKNISLLRQLYTSLSERITTLYPRAKFITDNSKSIWLLNDWLHVLPPEDIRIIWLQRNVRANVSSFVKRGSPFFTSLIRILLNNYTTDRFLAKNKLEFLVVHYDRFYASYAEEAKAMSDFLGIEIPSVFTPHENHHVISGNFRTRQSFTKEFEGVRKDDEWIRILTPVQKKILSWIN